MLTGSRGLPRYMLGISLAMLTNQGVVCAADTSEVVKIDSGAIHGAIAEDILSFKGVPYAAAPVGRLRWRPPQKPAAWKGVRDATTFGGDCLQEPFPGDAAPSRVPFSEDCLYVNVWEPARHAPALPVIVWIHGGGFVNGGSSPLIYDGTGFARSGVILVSFNYRLGNLGFFAHPALSAEQAGAPLGNYGLMDQIAVLQWVQRNVEAFGGNPRNVTVLGESAGGISINALIVSPMTRGLFQKAIVESGAGRPGQFGVRPVSGDDQSAEAFGLKLAERFGIHGNGADALEKLRAIPGEALAKGLQMATMSSDHTYVGGPILDGKLIVGDPATLLIDDQGARIPIIVGATNMDLGFAQGSSVDELLRPFGENSAAARKIYDPSGGASVRDVAARIGGDTTMIEPARHMARIFSARGQPVYAFRFSYVPEALRATTSGAFHASELSFVFDNVKAVMHGSASASDIAMAHAMHGYWVGFAKTGIPHAVGARVWQRYEQKADSIIDFTNSGVIVGPDPWRQRLNLVETLSDKRESDAVRNAGGQ